MLRIDRSDWKCGVGFPHELYRPKVRLPTGRICSITDDFLPSNSPFTQRY